MAPCSSKSLILAVLSLVALSYAGPLGPLPNVTSSDVGLKEGSCVLGDVVYMEGDKFVGATPCEQCACAAGGVTCAQQRCAPRPGCKALHRPDHCCPTYQCECELEGRVYGNGEKLVDPSDPCRVCYCQGGEVVCRRIACFLRDDCQPRLVKGRCCPEYDNCPLRGVTTISGMPPSVSSSSTIENVASSAAPSPKENIKQEITIKEITPVSEIPVITDVKIKEILPSPSIEVPEYPSSKSPLIPREAVPEKPVTNSADSTFKTEEPVVIDLISPLPIEESSKSSETSPETKSADLTPSKISLSTQDSINSDIYPSYIPTIIATMGVPALTPENVPAASTTRVTIIEEEDTSLFDHNPAFPPIPDDLSVIGTHEDEILHEQNVDGDHMTSVHEIPNVTSTPAPTEAPAPKETSVTTIKSNIDTTTTARANDVIEPISTTTSRTIEQSVDSSTANVLTTTVQKEASKDSPMLNLRSAIPTEILNVPSSVPEDINGELDDDAESVTAFEEPLYNPTSTSTTTESANRNEEATSSASQVSTKVKNIAKKDEAIDFSFSKSSQRVTEVPELLTTKNLEELTTSSVSKSNIATEITSQTEFSSLPIETSDQNPHDSSENIQREKSPSTTDAPLILEITTKLTTEPEVVTVSKAAPSIPENHSFENVETTEFVLTSFGSSESSTDAVELIKVSPTQSGRNAAVIDSTNGKKTNVLTDLINLVGDVASISDHTEAPEIALRTTTSSSFSADSEELMPVNAGYKSKNSNFNLNSITEIPLKSKNQVTVNKQKVVEIEDEDEESITDSPPPHDKVEPTTRRPIIDNVSDTMPKNETDRKDFEIFTQSYVPTINRNRPTKVVMKKNNEKALLETTEKPKPMTGSELSTDSPQFSGEMSTAPPAATAAPAAPAESDATTTTPAQ